MLPVLVITVLLVLPQKISSITTPRNDKQEINKELDMEMVKEMLITNSTETSNERQRRLIPYMTFYLTHNYNQPSLQEQRYRLLPQKIRVQPPIYPSSNNKYILAEIQPKYVEAPHAILYRPKVQYTPFLDSNKLPGRFTPLLRNPPIQIQQDDHQYVQNTQQYTANNQQYHSNNHQYEQQDNSPQYEQNSQHYEQPIVNEPNFSVIFEKLLQMKQAQNKPAAYISAARPQYQIPKANIAAQYFTREYVTRRPPAKYIPVPIEEYHQQSVQEHRYKEPSSPVKTIVHTYTPANIEISPESHLKNYDNFESLKIYKPVPPPVKVQSVKPIQAIVQNEEYKHISKVVPEKNYETIILRPVPKPQTYQFSDHRPYYQPPQYSTVQKVTVTTPEPEYIPTENPNSLSVILKQLQDSNTLPQTLTPDNIDNSIKTLVGILNNLKHTKLQRPIIVDEISQDEGNEDIQQEEEHIPVTISENYPANTPEGGTPGKPGMDYPSYSTIPQTSFSCKAQRYKGFFGDPETNCQVWHYCDLNGGQASFLCPNGTIFSQVALTCDWWYNVKCATTTQLYVLNERLYKYILPFTPKFPEDYSGPLVDKYLALKFKEMEEKMKKQKKGKIQKPGDDTREGDVDKLQIIEAETITKILTTESSEDPKK